ncbi:MAG: hypothetical protein A2169_03675 [Deltaproteobacteria bacterium RBG_13_47_9]|nr:MAG: hypothetical protein A2169_03675 [Deltaproteobacteria bacterium RBG_13_47_9]
MKRIVPFSILVLILSLSLASEAPAQVQTRIRIIQASNVDSNIDPSLRDVHGQLGSLFNFTSYRLLRDETLSLSPNQPAEISVHKDISLEITWVGKHKNIPELRVIIKRQRTDILNTQVRLSPGRTVLIGGPKHGEGVAILAFSAGF